LGFHPSSKSYHGTVSLLGWDWLCDRSVTIASTLHALAVDTRGTRSREATLASLGAAIEVDIFEVEGVDVARDVSVDWPSAVVIGVCEVGYDN
jgi:hypothetical protein